MYSIAETCFG